MNTNKENKIKALKRSIESIQSVLQYADGQAYYQDKREIERLRQQIRDLEQE